MTDPTSPDVAPPDVTSLDLQISVTDFPTGWNAAIARWPRIDVATSDLAAARPRAVSISLRKSKIKTIS